MRMLLTLISVEHPAPREREQEQGNQFNQMWESKDRSREYIITTERDLYNFKNYRQEGFHTREQEANTIINFIRFIYSDGVDLR